MSEQLIQQQQQQQLQWIQFQLHGLTCCKCLLAACEHDRADACISVNAFQRCVQLVHQSVAQCVQCLRSVEGDESDVVVLASDCNDQEFVWSAAP